MKPVATFPLEGVQLRDRLLEISQICFVSEDFQTSILIWGPFFHAYLVTYVGMWPGKLVIGRIVLHCSSSIGEESSDNVSNLLLLLTQGISVRFLRVVLVLKWKVACRHLKYVPNAWSIPVQWTWYSTCLIVTFMCSPFRVTQCNVAWSIDLVERYVLFISFFATPTTYTW